MARMTHEEIEQLTIAERVALVEETYAPASPPPNKALQRTSNSSVQLTLVAVWRHTVLAGSGPVSAVAGR